MLTGWTAFTCRHHTGHSLIACPCLTSLHSRVSSHSKCALGSAYAISRGEVSLNFCELFSDLKTNECRMCSWGCLIRMQWHVGGRSLFSRGIFRECICTCECIIEKIFSAFLPGAGASSGPDLITLGGPALTHTLSLSLSICGGGREAPRYSLVSRVLPALEARD